MYTLPHPSILARATRRLAPLAAVLALGTLPLQAQQQEPATPAEEPSSYDTLFEQSDPGNVVQKARMHHLAAVRQVRQAEKLATKAAREADPEKRAGLETKETEAYEAAAAELVQAVNVSPRSLDSYSLLGEVLRRLKKPEEALKVHVAALKAAPDDDENFAGWAETILDLDMLGDATTAHDKLVETNPKRAAILMTAMKAWLEEHRADPDGLAPEHIDRMAQWIAAHEPGA